VKKELDRRLDLLPHVARATSSAYEKVLGVVLVKMPGRSLNFWDAATEDALLLADSWIAADCESEILSWEICSCSALQEPAETIFEMGGLSSTRVRSDVNGIYPSLADTLLNVPRPCCLLCGLPLFQTCL
jgi:hypothetical protein